MHLYSGGMIRFSNPIHTVLSGNQYHYDVLIGPSLCLGGEIGHSSVVFLCEGICQEKYHLALLTFRIAVFTNLMAL